MVAVRKQYKLHKEKKTEYLNLMKKLKTISKSVKWKNG